MNISINRESSIPVYKQIRDQIRELILNGQLQPGFRLPPERKFADKLGVNRSTVLNAYRDLRADGLIGSHIGQGTVVNPPAFPVGAPGPENFTQLPWKHFLNESAIRMQQPLVSNVLRLANRRGVISFAAGLSTCNSDPLQELLETEERLLKEHGSALLQYSATEGLLPLRENLCGLMKERGVKINSDEVVVLSGAQQGIDLTARILLEPGDSIVVEEPSFFGALQIFQSSGARIIGAPIDGDGLRVDILETILQRHKPKLIYTIPNFQNPSGMVMNLKRRQELLNLAYRYQVAILEDDAYADLRYDGADLPSLKALDHYDHVIYLGSFSKILFPGLRLGWVAAPRQLIRQYILMKQMADLHSNTLAQWLMADFLERGVYAKQVTKVRSENRKCRDLMAEALKQYTANLLDWRVPEGGLYFWCRLPEGVDQNALNAKSNENKVVYVPGNIFYANNSGQEYLRLSFASAPPEQIKTGVKMLAQAITEVLDAKIQAEADSSFMEIKPIL